MTIVITPKPVIASTNPNVGHTPPPSSPQQSPLSSLNAMLLEILNGVSQLSGAASPGHNMGIPSNEIGNGVNLDIGGQLGSSPVVDDSAQAATLALSFMPKPISGPDFANAIRFGTADQDGNGATSEFETFKAFAEQNWDGLSPQARQVFRTYEGEANKSRLAGRTGISGPEVYPKLDAVANARPGFKDLSMVRAFGSAEGQVEATSMWMERFKNGVGDADGQLFGREFDDLAAFMDRNWEKMPAPTKAAFKVYEEAAKYHRTNGGEGASAEDFANLVARMERAAAGAVTLPPLPIRI